MSKAAETTLQSYRNLTVRRSRPPTAAAELSTLVPSPALCAQPLIPALGPAPGALKPFWPPALVQQAPPAILLAALRRFRGPAVFLGLRTSSRLGAPFWPSGLTVRRSRPPTAAAELRALVPVNLTLQSSWFTHRPSLLQAFFRWVFCRVRGFARIGCAGSKPFWPPAHASQAQAAMGLVALRIHAPFCRRG